MPSLTANELTLTIKATDEASATLRKVQKELDGVGASASKNSKETSNLSRWWGTATDASMGLAKGVGIAGAATVALGAVGMGGLMNYAVKSTREVQGYVAGIKALTGSTEEASSTIKSMIDYVQGKPFDRIDVLGATRQLLAYGRTSGQVKGDVELLGKAVLLSGGDWGDLARVYGNVMTSGRLMTDQFNQLQDGGIALGDILSKNLGVSVGDLRKLLSEGKVTAEDFHKAMTEALPDDVIAESANTIDNKLMSLNSSWRNLGFTILGVDFSKVDANGQPLVKPGGLLDRSITMIETLSTLLKDPAIKAGFQWLGDSAALAAETGLKLFGNALENLPKLLGWLKDNGPIVAGVVLGALTPAMIALAGAGLSAAIGLGSAVLALAPFIILGGLIGFAINEVVKHFGGWGATMEWLKGIGQGVYSFFTETLPAGFTIAFQLISEKAVWLKDNFWGTVGFIIGFFALLPIKLPLYIVMAIAAIIHYLGGVNWGQIFSNIGNAMGAAWDGVKTMAKNAWDYLKGLNWGGIMLGVGKATGNAVVDLLNGAIRGAFSGVPVLKDHIPQIPRFATGTNFAPGGMAWVGERGPELVNLPRGSQVHTNAQSKQMGGGRGGEVVINVANQIINNENDAKSWARQLGVRVNP